MEGFRTAGGLGQDPGKTEHLPAERLRQGHGDNAVEPAALGAEAEPGQGPADTGKNNEADPAPDPGRDEGKNEEAVMTNLTLTRVL